MIQTKTTVGKANHTTNFTNLNPCKQKAYNNAQPTEIVIHIGFMQNIVNTNTAAKYTKFTIG